MTVLPVFCKKVWIKAIVRFESFESFHLLSKSHQSPANPLKIRLHAPFIITLYGRR